MKNFTIELFDIDYSGNDFCGEISPSEAAKIIKSQPEVMTLTFSMDDDEMAEWDERASKGESDDWLVDDIVYGSWPNGLLLPTSYSYGFV